MDTRYKKELPDAELKQNMDALINIAYFARVISKTHPGWEEWEKLPYCSESRPRETNEAKLRHQFYYKPRTQKRISTKSYKGKTKLFVLTDRETSSSAEFVFPLFKQYQGTKFIGENTKGCCQYVWRSQSY